MQPATPLPLIEKAAAIALRAMATDAKSLATMSATRMATMCSCYRRIGICRLLQRYEVETTARFLRMSAQAHAAWLAAVPAAKRQASRREPFLDAVVADGLAQCADIHRLTGSAWVPGGEYEEDFAYARILQVFCCQPQPEQEVRQLLDFWAGVSGGGELRYALCQALLDRDAAAAQDVLRSLLDERLAQVRTRQRDESGDADERATTDHLCLEAIAVAKLAKRCRGLEITLHHVQFRDELLAEFSLNLPADAWKNIEQYL